MAALCDYEELCALFVNKEFNSLEDLDKEFFELDQALRIMPSGGALGATSRLHAKANEHHLNEAMRLAKKE